MNCKLNQTESIFGNVRAFGENRFLSETSEKKLFQANSWCESSAESAEKK